MAFDPTPEDMAAAKAQGDLVEMLLAAGGRERKNASRPEAPADDAVKLPPFAPALHRPGAWPVGTRPAGPETCHPDCDCALIKPEEP